jgi:hypothetical protein
MGHENFHFDIIGLRHHILKRLSSLVESLTLIPTESCLQNNGKVYLPIKTRLNKIISLRVSDKFDWRWTSLDWQTSPARGGLVRLGRQVQELAD